MRTIEEVITKLGSTQNVPELVAPNYAPNSKGIDNLFLGARIMSKHTADAGWQLTLGFKHVGYQLWGKDFKNDEVNVKHILNQTNPQTVVLQDKREWDGKTAAFKDPSIRFHNVETLKERDDLFKLTILKDAQQRPTYHAQSADQMGAHAWITYYYPSIVKHVAPYVRPQHCIRTYHSVDRYVVPPFIGRGRKEAVITGAVSGSYPLRSEIVRAVNHIPNLTYRRHPGYKARGCHTPEYLKFLSQYKISICTSSRYGYSLRKIIESTACGCIVLTDLPVDDVLPGIDSNLVRFENDFSKKGLANLIRGLSTKYNPERQEHFAEVAKDYYDYRTSAVRLAENIERLRTNYVV